MESTSSQTYDSDATQRCLLTDSYGAPQLVDGELSKTIIFCGPQDNHLTQQSTGDSPSVESAPDINIGMEFNSRDAAREFYIAYGRRVGFTVRIHHNRRSQINNMVIGQDFVCSKEGFREKKYVCRKDRILPPPPVTREGCAAMLRIALRDSGKWVVTKFVKYHNHSLLSPSKVPWRGSAKNSISQDEKDQRIREPTLELYNERQKCKRKCAAFREQLSVVLKYVEEHTNHLSRSVQNIVQNVRELEK